MHNYEGPGEQPAGEKPEEQLPDFTKFPLRDLLRSPGVADSALGIAATRRVIDEGGENHAAFGNAPQAPTD